MRARERPRVASRANIIAVLSRNARVRASLLKELVGARLVTSRDNNSPWSLAAASLLGGAVAAMPTDPATLLRIPRRPRRLSRGLGGVEGLALCLGRLLGPVKAFLSPRFGVKGFLEQNRRIASVLHAASNSE